MVTTSDNTHEKSLRSLHSLLAPLRICIRRRFQGRWAGERQSRARGVGLEFADYRPYEPGDDLRTVDWNLYARLARLYVKVFLQEQNLPVTFLMDVSGSMALAQPSKWEHARALAMLLSYVALTHLDTVQALAIAEEIRAWLPPLHGRAQMGALETFLTRLSPEGHTDLDRSVAQYLQRSRRPGVVFVLSDLFSQTPYREPLRRLAKAGNDVHLVHILAREELSPSGQGDFRLRDVETGQTREITLDETTRRLYQEEVERFCREIRSFCLAHEMTYTRTFSDEPLVQVIATLSRNGILG